jgi:heterodisulfide reductase subunit A
MAIAAALRARVTLTARVPVRREVLVIGGGVSGLTAALMLANAGVKVHLVERDAFLGGHMAKWDKTFPTLDCAICTLGPVMTEVYRHENITVHTLSEVVSVRGTPGNFEVHVLQKPRFIDEEECNGCNKCIDACPVTVPNEYSYGIGERKAVVKYSPQSVPSAPYIDVRNCIGCMACVAVCERPNAIRFTDRERKVVLNVGAIIIATGFRPFDASALPQYGYGRFKDVITGPELECMLNANGPTKGRVIRLSDYKNPESVAFIQCVGSRSPAIGRDYCSKVCCLYAIKQAIELKRKYPGIDVCIFYTDLRVGVKGGEEAYLRALEEGVRFVRGRVSHVKQTRKGKLRLFFEDTLEGAYREEDFDLVVLSVGMESPDGVADLARLLRVPIGNDGFLIERHPKLRPADTIVSGVFLAGACSGPKDISECVEQAGLAASRAYEFVTSAYEREIPIGTIERRKCTLCGLCVTTCEYGALSIANKAVVYNAAACSGCGSCAAVCPEDAIVARVDYTNEQISAMLSEALREKAEVPLVIGFLCRWCGHAAADSAGVSRFPYPTNVRFIRVECSGRVSPSHIVEALKLGADGVLVVGCYEQDCQYGVGRVRANERISRLRTLLEEAGIRPERVEIFGVSAGEGAKFARLVTDFVKRIAELGPIGVEVGAAGDE